MDDMTAQANHHVFITLAYPNHLTQNPSTKRQEISHETYSYSQSNTGNEDRSGISF